MIDQRLEPDDEFPEGWFWHSEYSEDEYEPSEEEISLSECNYECFMHQELERRIMREQRC